MSLDRTLLDIIVCPKDHGPLTYLEDQNVLVNERLGIAYPIEDDVPVLLEAEATTWPPAEH